ncbi:MAG: proprotein convertase P-domain-containing protein [Deltaproteobacteria bacterium]|nr:proprotein convertase P-domain-containing protein [Deltaproteobacteria bacterium]
MIRICIPAFILALACGCGADPTTEVDELQHAVKSVYMSCQIESPHPYADYLDQTWTLSAPPEASSLSVTFDRLECERNYDFVELYDAEGLLVERLTGNHSGRSFRVDGNELHIRLLTDYSVQRYGFLLTGYSYELGDLPSDHRPFCGRIGTRSEGWYWADTDELIAWARCASMGEPVCSAIGSRSEGWFADGQLIVWDACHRTVRIAVAGEACGPSIGFSCHEDLYCAGVPTGRIGGSGTCLPAGSCETEADCTNPDNHWSRPRCIGFASCEEGACVWYCGEPGIDLVDEQVRLIPDADPQGISGSLELADLPRCPLGVRVDVSIGHSYIGDLVVVLEAPGGELLGLHDRQGGSADDLRIEGLELDSAALSSLAGRWTLHVSDHAFWDVGQLESWALHFSCR